MTRGGARSGAGRLPLAGQSQTERIGLKLTEAERAEIEGAVPEDRTGGRWIVEAAIMRARGQLPMRSKGRPEMLAHQALSEGAQRCLVRHLMMGHPLPWRLEFDWTVEITDVNNVVVIKCMHVDEANEIVGLAKLLAAGAGANAACEEVEQPRTKLHA